MKSVSELMNLDGQVALIVGGGGHIGLAAAESILELGGQVILADLSQAGLDRNLASLAEAYPEGQAASFLLDLEDYAAISACPERIRELAAPEQARLDTIIHTAALVSTTELDGWGVPFEAQSLETWDRALRVNLSSAFALVQACMGLLRESPSPRVVLVGSIYGFCAPDYSLYEETQMGNPGAYSASKAGLIQLARWMASTLAPEVRINVISPGGIYRGQDEAFVQRYSARTKLDRMGREEDLKGAIAYLASDLSAYVTGQNLVVDGGWSL